MKCEWCPLKDRGFSCYSEEAKICFHLDPTHKRYNPAYAAVIEKQSLVKAGLAEREPIDFSKAPAWLQEALRPGDSIPGPSDSTSPSEGVVEPEMPPLWKQTLNFTKAVVKHAAGGMRAARDEVRQERLKICQSCEFLTQDRKCMKCGCPVDTKTAWATEKCPIDKWLEDDGPVQPESGGCCGQAPSP